MSTMTPYSGTSKRTLQALNESIKRRRTEKRSLWELRLVALLILAWGVLNAVVEIQHGGTNPFFTFDSNASGQYYSATFTDFCILVFAGLWLRSGIGRPAAILMSWCGLLGGVLLALRLFPFGGITATSEINDLAAGVPEKLLRVGVFPFMILQVWQLHVLNREDIRALLRPRLNPTRTAAASLSVRSK